MFNKEITFDRFIRGVITLLLLAVGCFMLHYLSSVLIPFFLAWFVAYLLHPVVTFLQVRCRLRNRLLCIILTLTFVFGALGATVWFGVPLLIEECVHCKNVLLNYVSGNANHPGVPAAVHEFVKENLGREEIVRILREENVSNVLKNAVPKLWEMLWSTANVIFSLVSSLIALLYLFFLLKDYEKYSTGWVRYVPKARRDLVMKLVADVEHGMSGYFRGQVLVAMSNCVMFSVGFWLIGIPFPVGLGCFIGIISFVPYLQLLGFLPATLLALLNAVETGSSFWWMMGGVVLVYCVVQVIQDAVVTPKVMGRIMGLSPGIVLLSLSVWGYMLGIIGLIIALPATTLLMSYYRNFIEHDDFRMD